MPWRRQMAICLPQSVRQTHFLAVQISFVVGHFGWGFSFFGSGMILGRVRRFKVKLTSPMDTPNIWANSRCLYWLMCSFINCCCCSVSLLPIEIPPLVLLPLLYSGFSRFGSGKGGHYQSPLLEQMESHSQSAHTCFLFPFCRMF